MRAVADEVVVGVLPLRSQQVEQQLLGLLRVVELSQELFIGLGLPLATDDDEALELVDVEEVDALGTTDRGTGGFGSTGR